MAGRWRQQGRAEDRVGFQRDGKDSGATGSCWRLAQRGKMMKDSSLGSSGLMHPHRTTAGQ